jgi:hypothetical protein
VRLACDQHPRGEHGTWVAILGLALALGVILAYCLGRPPGANAPGPPLAPAGHPAESSDTPLTVEVSPDGGLTTAGRSLSPQEWDTRVTTEIARREGRAERVEVVLRVDGRARGKVVNSLLKRLKDAGISRVQIALTSGAGTMVEEGR